MESTLFSWDDFYTIDANIDQFVKVELVVGIGEFLAGERFDCAAINYADGVLELMRGSDKWKFRLGLQVGEQLKGE